MKSATMMMTMMLLLGSTSLAVAECAWVLWKAEEDGPKRWKAVAAFETRDKCLRESQTYAARSQTMAEKTYALKQPDPPVSVTVVKHPGGYTVQVTREGFSVPYLDFVCFPETFDPREKK